MNDTAGRERRAAALSNEKLLAEFAFCASMEFSKGTSGNFHVENGERKDALEAELLRRLNATDAASAARSIGSQDSASAAAVIPGEELTVEWAQEMICVPVESIENVIDIAEFGRKRLDAGHYGAIIAACQVMLAAESAEASGDN